MSSSSSSNAKWGALFYDGKWASQSASERCKAGAGFATVVTVLINVLTSFFAFIPFSSVHSISYVLFVFGPCCCFCIAFHYYYKMFSLVIYTNYTLSGGKWCGPLKEKSFKPFLLYHSYSCCIFIFWSIKYWYFQWRTKRSLSVTLPCVLSFCSFFV